MSADGWEAAAPFYDLVDDAARPEQALRELKHWLAAATRGVLDIGAGTGTLGLAVAEAYPDLPVVLAEPSAGMRIALLTKLAGRRQLWDRVTVLVDDAMSVAPRQPVDLALCIAVLWALEPADRAAALAAAARAVGPGGILVVDAPAYRDRPVHPTRRSRQVLPLGTGTVELEYAVRPEPGSAGEGRHRIDYRFALRDGDDPGWSTRWSAVMWAPPRPALLAGLAAAGFTLDTETDTYLILRHHPSR